MTSSQRLSVRARGARRLTQLTAGMVIAGVGGALGLAAIDAHAGQASPGSAAKGTSTNSATDTTTGGMTDSTSATDDMSGPTGSGVVSSTQSTPQATSGGS